MNRYDKINKRLHYVNQLLNDSSIIGPKREFSELELVVIVLRTKALAHAQMAVCLMTYSNSTADAIVILRCAYEADIVALYLEQHPEEFERYMAHSAMVNYKNAFNVVELTRSDVEEEIQEEAKEHLAAQKEFLKQNNYLSILNIDEKLLDDSNYLQRTFGVAQFNSFWKLKRACKFDENSQFLNNGFQLYNLGSQIAHSNLATIKDMYIAGLSNEHQLFPATSIYGNMIAFILYNYMRILNADALDPRHYETIRNLLLTSLKENSELLRQKF